MGTKERKDKRIFFYLCVLCILVSLIIIYMTKIQNKEIYAVNDDENIEQIQISQAKKIELNDIIRDELIQIPKRIEIYEKNEELEYITKYRNNSELYIGTTKIVQEGKNGIQTITFKKNYDSDGNLINEEQVNCRVTKSSIDKIIEVGSKKNDRNYKWGKFNKNII